MSGQEREQRQRRRPYRCCRVEDWVFITALEGVGCDPHRGPEQWEDTSREAVKKALASMRDIEQEPDQ